LKGDTSEEAPRSYIGYIAFSWRKKDSPPREKMRFPRDVFLLKQILTKQVEVCLRPRRVCV